MQTSYRRGTGARRQHALGDVPQSRKNKQKSTIFSPIFSLLTFLDLIRRSAIVLITHLSNYSGTSVLLMILKMPQSSPGVSDPKICNILVSECSQMISVKFTSKPSIHFVLSSWAPVSN